MQETITCWVSGQVKAPCYGAWMSHVVLDQIWTMTVPTGAGSFVGQWRVRSDRDPRFIALRWPPLVDWAPVDCRLKQHMKGLPLTPLCTSLAVVCGVKRSTWQHHKFQGRPVDVTLLNQLCGLALTSLRQQLIGCSKLGWELDILSPTLSTKLFFF